MKTNVRGRTREVAAVRTLFTHGRHAFLLACAAGALAAAALARQAPPTAPGGAAGPPASPSQVFIRPATIDDTLEVTGDPVAAKEVNTRMQVGVTVDGHGPYRFMVDSGADRTVIGETLAQRLGLEAADPVTLHSTGSARRVGTVRIGRLQVGASRVDNIVAPALPERYVGADGLLGIDALIDQRLTIDFDAKTVIVQDTQAPEAAAQDGEIVITARRRKGQLILTQVTVGRTVAAVIDTGTEITIGNEALRSKLLRRQHQAVMTTDLISVTGDVVHADLLPVPEIHIGNLTLKNVLIAFCDMPPFKLFGLDQQPAVLLGTDILQAFRRVSLDFRRRKVRFVLKPESR